MHLLVILLFLIAGHGDGSPQAVISQISSFAVSVEGGPLFFQGANLADPLFCVFHFKVKHGPSVERVRAAVSSNASSAECLAPRTPYRIVMHHQHRAPWPCCAWDERCMANLFSLSLESQDVILRRFNMSYYYGSFAQAIEHKSSDSSALHDHLFAMNHPADCYRARVLLMKNPQHQGQCTGIGMVFYSHYITALKQAYEQNRALVLKDSFSSYCYLSDRTSNQEELYILPPSNCTMENINPSLAVEFKAEKAWFVTVERPPHLQHIQGVAWFRANFLKYLFRYTPSFSRHLETVEMRVGFSRHKPCIGVHLRRGERGNLGFTTIWLADYPLFDLADAVRLLRIMKSQTGVNTVVLATDEPRFFADISKYASEFHILHDDFYKRAEAGRDCVRETIAGCTPGTNATTVTRTILTELHLLSQCQYYAGTLTSTFSKLAVDYMLANQNKSVVVSLE